MIFMSTDRKDTLPRHAQTLSPSFATFETAEKQADNLRQTGWEIREIVLVADGFEIHAWKVSK